MIHPLDREILVTPLFSILVKTILQLRYAHITYEMWRYRPVILRCPLAGLQSFAMWVTIPFESTKATFTFMKRRFKSNSNGTTPKTQHCGFPRISSLMVVFAKVNLIQINHIH